MKKFLLIAVLSLLGSISMAADVQLQPTKEANIEFTAESQLTVPNDKATIYLSARAQDKNLATAQSTVNSTMDNAITILKKLSSTATIQNMGYSTHPLYSKPKEGEAATITGWEATQRIMITTVDLQEVPKLVQSAQESDLALTSINYGLTKETLAKTDEQLIANIVAETNRKATSIARAMNLPVESFKIDKMQFDTNGRVVDRPLQMRLAAADPNSVALPNFEPGTTEVTKRVQVVIKIGNQN